MSPFRRIMPLQVVSLIRVDILSSVTCRRLQAGIAIKMISRKVAIFSGCFFMIVALLGNGLYSKNLAIRARGGEKCIKILIVLKVPNAPKVLKVSGGYV